MRSTFHWSKLLCQIEIKASFGALQIKLEWMNEKVFFQLQIMVVKTFFPRHQFICKEGQETVFNKLQKSRTYASLPIFLGPSFFSVYFHSWRSSYLENLVLLCVRSTKSKLNTFMTVLFQKYSSNSKSPLLKRLVFLFSNIFHTPRV